MVCNSRLGRAYRRPPLSSPKGLPEGVLLGWICVSLCSPVRDRVGRPPAARDCWISVLTIKKLTWNTKLLPINLTWSILAKFYYFLPSGPIPGHIDWNIPERDIGLSKLAFELIREKKVGEDLIYAATYKKTRQVSSSRDFNWQHSNFGV